MLLYIYNIVNIYYLNISNFTIYILKMHICCSIFKKNTSILQIIWSKNVICKNATFHVIKLKFIKIYKKKSLLLKVAKFSIGVGKKKIGEKNSLVLWWIEMIL